MEGATQILGNYSHTILTSEPLVGAGQWVERELMMSMEKNQCRRHRYVNVTKVSVVREQYIEGVNFIAQAGCEKSAPLAVRRIKCKAKLGIKGGRECHHTIRLIYVSGITQSG